MFFLLNETTTTEIYTLSLHDALPISRSNMDKAGLKVKSRFDAFDTLENREDLEMLYDALGLVKDKNGRHAVFTPDRKSTRLNSSHVRISYAVFCLKKKTIT